jgi:WD40 repeat protein
MGEALTGIDQLLITPDGKRLVCGGESLSVWDLATGKELGPDGGHRAGVGRVLFSPDGRALASVDQTLGLGLWDVATGKPLIPSLQGGGFRAVGLTFAADGRELSALGIDASARTWDLTTGRLVREFSAGGEATARAWQEPVGDYLSPYWDPPLDRCAIVSPDGRMLAVIEKGRAVRLWDTATGKEHSRLEHPARVTAMAFSPGGRYLATQEAERAIRLWDTRTGKERREWLSRGSGGGYPSFFFSPDDRFLGWDDGSGIHLRDLATGKEVGQFEGRLDYEQDVAFLRGSQVLACWDKDDKLGLRDVSKGTLVRTVLACAPGARRPSLIATPGGGALAYFPVEVERPVYSLRDILTGREICQTSGRLECFAVSPDARVLAQAGSRIVFRELATGAVVGQLDEAHRGRVKALRFSPDGRALATAGWDSTLLVWDYAAAVGFADPPRSLSAAELDGAWSDLAGKDAARAYKAIGALAGSGDRSVPFLGERMQPASAKEQETMRRWITDLDSDDFDAREKAVRELAKLWWEAEPALLDALLANPSAEARVRIERILSPGTRIGHWPSDALRKSRAVCALERTGTPAAREILGQLARGAAEARLTREAKASLERLAQRTKAAP